MSEHISSVGKDKELVDLANWAADEIDRLSVQNEKMKSLINDIFEHIPAYDDNGNYPLSERIVDKWRSMTNEFGKIL